jgi:hypothetical protein
VLLPLHLNGLNLSRPSHKTIVASTFCIERLVEAMLYTEQSVEQVASVSRTEFVVVGVLGTKARDFGVSSQESLLVKVQRQAPGEFQIPRTQQSEFER